MLLSKIRQMGLLFLLAAVPALAAADLPAVTLREVASGLEQPLEIVNAHDRSGRLFVVEKTGAIRIIRNGQLLAMPFLDLRAQISTSNERGLLGLAFHPQFRFNRRFFVYYTQLPDDGTGGALRVSSFLASMADPDRADPASELEIITIPHPGASNHNGGHIAFGPGGYLFIGTGDGGGGGDPGNNAQNLSSLLGKLLRIDINVPSGYAIPANPFNGVAGARGEIWAYGLRNPWKYSFDRQLGDLYIGDVGQGAVEEIDFVPAPSGGDAGLNFGWRVFEGTQCFNPASGCATVLPGATPPVLQYFHDSAGGQSVTGGYVYRGTRTSALRGYYIYGDYISDRVWAAIRSGGVWNTSLLAEATSTGGSPNVLSGITSFGEDEAGEIYVASIVTGKVHAIDGIPDSAVSTNVALAAAGARAQASSTYGSGFPPSAVIDGERSGGNWGAGSGWNDATPGAYPDWVEVDLAGMRTIDRVVVYTLQDNVMNPIEPYDTTTFTRYGIVDFSVEGWNGTMWVMLGTVTGNNLVKRTLTFAPVTVDRVRVNVTRAMGGYSHITEVEAWTALPAVPAGTNVALASAGGMASASSAYGPGFPPSAAIDGDRAGMNWGNGSGWNDATFAAYPDWLQVAFNGMKTIDRVVVYTLQDNATNPMEPTDTMTFTSYGIVDFTVEGWNGAMWVMLGTVTGNNLVKRTLTFAPVTVDRVRVNVTRAMGGYSHITELEAWGVTASTQTNVALASTGAMASASSTYGPGFPPSAAIDGDRAGRNWGSGSGWNDATFAAYPDWLQVAFNGTKTIDRVVVYTLQDSATNPMEPTDTMTFTSYGIVDFTVEGWNGSAWMTLATVTGNNLVKRTVSFAPLTTDRVRVNVTRAMGGYSHVTEVEAWGS